MTTLPIDDFGERIQVLRPGGTQTVAIGAASQASAPFGATTTVIRVVATSHCFLMLGHSPTATAGGHYLPAGAPEYFHVVPGEALAALRAASDGTLYVSEMV
jgi:hypothetical protein